MKDEFLGDRVARAAHAAERDLGWARMLRDRTRSARGARRGASTTIERNALAQTQLIEDLLDVSRDHPGKLRLDVAADRHRATCVDARDRRVQPAADGQGHQLDVDDRLPTPGRSPATRIACSRSSGTCCRTRSSSRRRRPGRVPRRARGRGTSRSSSATPATASPPTFLPHVFDRFRQARQPARRRRTAASGWASRSCAISSSCTAGPSRRSAAVPAEARPSPCGFRPRRFRPTRAPAPFARRRRNRPRVNCRRSQASA